MSYCLLIFYIVVILVLYLPLTIGGFFVYGEAVTPNFAMILSKTSLVTIANVLMAVHLILAFLIVINPVSQELEEIFKVPRCKFCFLSLQFSFIFFCNICII